ncbi:hypothetical protein [Catellatospora vulcania]|uniref:hypothetical protein n=1 Tax=Catellatospora vulcania TaxID=1460450 RepID=UPI0012D48274|nr:hypothetical protein [Catellatospora vulcania]
MLNNINIPDILVCFSVAAMVVFALGYFGGRAFARRRPPAGLDQTASVLAGRQRTGEITRDAAIADLARCYPALSATQISEALDRNLPTA